MKNLGVFRRIAYVYSFCPLKTSENEEMVEYQDLSCVGQDKSV